MLVPFWLPAIFVFGVSVIGDVPLYVYCTIVLRSKNGVLIFGFRQDV